MIRAFRSSVFVKVDTFQNGIYITGIYIIKEHYMAAWRYEMSLLVLKNIYLVRCVHSGNISSTLEEKFRIFPRACNILYLFKFHTLL